MAPFGNKYVDILKLMSAKYPEILDAGNDLNKDPHKKSEISTTKLKIIRIQFRQAVDSGKKVGMEEYCSCTWISVSILGVVLQLWNKFYQVLRT